MRETEMQTWTTLADKSAWGQGPWVDEPDKAQWTDPATGLQCLAVRNARDGHWCGYVGVSLGHPLHGQPAEGTDLVAPREVNYADCCQDDDRPIEQRICHIPEPGQPDDLWWFGFDCGHVWDLQPAKAAQERAEGVDHAAMAAQAGMPMQYRTLDDVQAGCAVLAAQLHAVPGQDPDRFDFEP